MDQADQSPRAISYGGKADNLIRLRAAGFDVPWFTLIRQEHRREDLAALPSRLDPKKAYAVRSSASLEDQSATAMAGLFETFLNVKVSAIPDKVQLCFDSGLAPRVRDFLAARSLEWDGAMTVIVQEMLDPDLSGVLFTANPQGILNEMMAVVGRGPGIGVVEDLVPVTTLIHHDQDGLDLIALQPGSPELSRVFIAKLTELGRRLRSVYPDPVDAEFALAGEGLWLLQARPITSLDVKNVTVLDNSNISESYPGLTLPLSIDFARTAYAGIFGGLMAEIFGRALPKELIPILEEMVTASSGRMYYQINHWYQIMKLLPLSSAYIKVWQEMMGVRQRAIGQTPITLRFSQRIRGLWRLVRALARTPQEMERLEGDFQLVRSRFEAMATGGLDPSELKDLYELLRSQLLSRWHVTLLNDIHAFVFTALLKRTDHSPGQTQISQLGQVESLKPVSLLRRMARLAPVEVLELESPEAVHRYIQRDDPFSGIIRDYIADYGDRYLEELKLESKTFRTNPELLVEMLRQLRASDDRQDHTVPVGSDLKSRGRSPKTDLKHRHSLNGRGLSGVIRRRAAQAIRWREISRLNRTRIFGMARAIFLALGKDLADSGKLAEASDVFWLTQAEVFSAGEGLRTTVTSRKESYQAFAEVPMLSRLEFAGAVFDRTLPGSPTTGGNQGGPLLADGASPGIARGRVLLVEDPATASEVGGRILVTRQTDPGWVFLIIQAAGIIAEKGSLLSHTAIIARELGKPVVVGLPGALRRFTDGEWVEINGRTGEIRRLSDDERD